MPNRSWRKYAPYAVAGLIVVLAAVSAAVLSDWGPFRGELDQSNFAPGCDGQQTGPTAEQASRDYEVAEAAHGDPAIVENYKRAAEAAEQTESKTKECEAVARNRSDLAAQWANAHMARGQRTWVIFSVLASIGTIGVAGAAILQSHRAFKKDFEFTQQQIDIARSVGENQARAFVSATLARITVKTIPKNALVAPAAPAISPLIIMVANTGQTPAIGVRAEARIWTGTLMEPNDAIALEFDQKDQVDALTNKDARALGFRVPEGQFEPRQKFSDEKSGGTDYDRQLRADVVAALNKVFSAEAKIIYCRGRVVYRDIFRDKFESEFFFRWMGAPEEGQEITMWSVAADLRVFHLIESRPKTDPPEPEK